MTSIDESTDGLTAEPRPSLLPFRVEDLLTLRYLPAEFARAIGVSKQSVSRWIAAGKVTLGPDGRLDPTIAIKQVIRTTDPAKLRVRILKNALAGRSELIARVKSLETQIADLRMSYEAQLADLRRTHAAALQATNYRHSDELAGRLVTFEDALLANFAELALARDSGGAEDFLENLIEKVFYDQDRNCEEDRDDANTDHGATVADVVHEQANNAGAAL